MTTLSERMQNFLGKSGGEVISEAMSHKGHAAKMERMAKKTESMCAEMKVMARKMRNEGMGHLSEGVQEMYSEMYSEMEEGMKAMEAMCEMMGKMHEMDDETMESMCERMKEGMGKMKEMREMKEAHRMEMMHKHSE